jgi:hypothetical protein
VVRPFPLRSDHAQRVSLYACEMWVLQGRKLRIDLDRGASVAFGIEFDACRNSCLSSAVLSRGSGDVDERSGQVIAVRVLDRFRADIDLNM